MAAEVEITKVHPAERARLQEENACGRSGSAFTAVCTIWKGRWRQRNERRGARPHPIPKE
jgi:hypothetical protein